MWGRGGGKLLLWYTCYEVRHAFYMHFTLPVDDSVYTLIRRIVKKKKNKGRVFYNCSKPIEEQCHYYRWKEDERYT